jgi:hypothetical protein
MEIRMILMMPSPVLRTRRRAQQRQSISEGSRPGVRAMAEIELLLQLLDILRAFLAPSAGRVVLVLIQHSAFAAWVVLHGKPPCKEMVCVIVVWIQHRESATMNVLVAS